MFSQLEEEISYVRGKGFWAIPVEDGDSRASMDDGIPKMDFGRGEVKNWGNTEGD